LWPPAAKTGVAYQESFVWREPISITTGSVNGVRTPERKTALPRSKQAFTKPELVLWPADGITKGDLIRYYDSIAPLMLPHIKQRLLMLERHPNGVGQPWFLQKDALPEETPKSVATEKVGATTRDEGSRYISYYLGHDRDQLLLLAELCTTTIHTWATTADAPGCADTLILDLDPFDVPFSTVEEVALVAKEILDALELRSFVKTSGATGLHILVPLLANTFSHERVRMVAAAIAKLIVDRRADTHRVAISNHRILSVTESEVRFRWKDYANHNKKRTMTLTGPEFLRRFLQHVLPKGFPRIRYFGWLANRKRGALLQLCRVLLPQTPEPPPTTSEGPAIRECPKCHSPMRIVEVLTAEEIHNSERSSAPVVMDTS
jgi:DNA ligase D-like protein (predicted polymerase)